MAKLANILLSEIDEPRTPIRISMDEEKFKALCQSMKDIGLLQPIGVKRSKGRYEIEFGHRRFKAAQALKWRDIPALVFDKQELSTGAAMLAENVEREDITAAEEAILFAQAQEQFKLDEAGLCKRFRRTPYYISSRFGLLRGDRQIFEAVQARKITLSAATALNHCTDEAHRRYLLDAAVRSEASAAVVTSWVSQWRSQSPAPASSIAASSTEALQQEIRASGIECCLCGGFRDPYNLVSVYIHKWELEQIREVMKRDMEGTNEKHNDPQPTAKV